MKTLEQQAKLLQVVADIAARQVVNCISHIDPTDVAYLAADAPKARQVVAASDNNLYDIWSPGRVRPKLVEYDVSLERAVEVIVEDYKQHKINVIMIRLMGKNWRQLDHKSELAAVTINVYDEAAQKAQSRSALLQRLAGYGGGHS